MAKRARPSREPVVKTSGPIEVEVTWQNDGGVYGLGSLSADFVRRRFPDAAVNPGILIGYDRKEGIDRLHRPY